MVHIVLLNMAGHFCRCHIVADSDVQEVETVYYHLNLLQDCVMFTFARLDCYTKAARFSAQWLYDIHFMLIKRDPIIGLNNIIFLLLNSINQL